MPGRERLIQAAELLRGAAQTHQYIEPLSSRFPELDLAAAYQIQRLNTEARLAAGARIVGAKIGLTSLAVQKQLGVDSPDYGVLLDEMEHSEGLPIPLAGLHQPKIEAEVAFVLGRDLQTERPGVADVLRAIEYALPALEIVGSRIADWKIRLVDTVADNASSSGFVLGATPRLLTSLDLRAAAMHLRRDGETVSTGTGAACLGHPVNAVVWLARTLAALGAPLREGDVILSGALGPMAAVQAGSTYTAAIDGLGSVTAVFDAQ